MLDIIIEAREKKGAQELMNVTTGKHTLGCKQVFTLKHNLDRTIQSYKARLVTKGFTQAYGIDYHEMFSLVATLNPVRIILPIIANLSDYNLARHIICGKRSIQFMHALTTEHLAADHRILRHLKGALGQNISYLCHGHLKIEAYLKVDWASSKRKGSQIQDTAHLLKKIDLMEEQEQVSCSPLEF